MDELAKYIEGRLVGRKCCVVFREALARAFPFLEPKPDRRIEQIHAFAESHGWTATVFDPGIRVTFAPKKEVSAAGKRALAGPARAGATIASVGVR